MPSFEEEIAAHAQADAPREACGFVMRGRRGNVFSRPTPNMSESPMRFFQIDPLAYLAAKNDPEGAELVGYYHSHPEGGPDPSPADRHNATSVGLPLYIYSVPSGVMGCCLPDGFSAPLEGRKFVPMVFDCVSLVWDYMRQERGLELPLLPRTRASYRAGVAFDWTPWLKQFAANVCTGRPQVGDVLIMMLDHATKPNHMGIYLGDGIFIHQRQVSKREVWAGQWQQATAYFIRLPAKPGSPAALRAEFPESMPPPL